MLQFAVLLHINEGRLCTCTVFFQKQIALLLHLYMQGHTFRLTRRLLNSMSFASVGTLTRVLTSNTAPPPTVFG